MSGKKISKEDTFVRKKIKSGLICQQKILKENTFVRKKYRKTTHLSGKNIKRRHICQEEILKRGHICEEWLCDSTISYYNL